jgi:predicted oxidoreductase
LRRCGISFDRLCQSDFDRYGARTQIKRARDSAAQEDMSFCPANGGPFNTGRIGFGCAYVTGGFEKRRNLKLLQGAFDCGIRHYDTAPMYGHGTSEDVVGEAFKHLRSQISVTTKVGISRPNFPLKRKLLRAIATPVRDYFPGLSQRSARVIYRRESVPKNFSVTIVRRSVEDSLSRLGTDYIDVLLLHEATLTDISEELLNTLVMLKSEGKIVRTGIGSAVQDIIAIDSAYPNFFDVYQRTWSILKTDERLHPNKTKIFHRSIMDALSPLREKLMTDPSFAQYMRNAAGVEAGAVDELARALISASIFVNLNGITLFGTRRPYRIADYAKAAGDLAPGIALLKAYRSYANSVSACEPVLDVVL